ncbi:MAG: GntR family transcriptional regulator [Caldimonas sp.]
MNPKLPNHPVVELQARQLLPERIAASLRETIVSGELGPGTRLVEHDVAKRLGVSRVPMREAFRVLAGEGLVTIHPNRGAMVSEVSETELVELFTVRALIEGHAAARLAAQPEPEVLERLDLMVADMKSAVRRRRFELYYSQAAEFHDALVRARGGQVLWQMYEQIRRLLRRYQAVMAGLPESPRRSILEHEQILAAIRSGDEALAERSARAHVDALVDRYREAGPKVPSAHGPRKVA